MLIITGQTATGKTGLALKLAKEFPIEIISADARQVYQDMDIGTGKIGTGDTLEMTNQMWYLNGVPLHGINLISPQQTFSSIQFAHYAKEQIKHIYARGNLPVIVGGTAFYLTTLLTPHHDQYVPPDAALRTTWKEKEAHLSKADFVDYLQTMLMQVNVQKFQSMNESDRANPRRLMRAIEITIATQTPPQTKVNSTDAGAMTLTSPVMILHAPLDYLEQKIQQRIQEMMSLGLEAEVTDLLRTYTWDSPGLQTIGYYEWRPYFEKEYDTPTVTDQIVLHNRQYARKQTIFLKRPTFAHAQWFDISHPTTLAECYATCASILRNAQLTK